MIPCFECNGSLITNCLSCITEYYLLSFTKECVKICPEQLVYPNSTSKKCELCHFSCLTCKANTLNDCLTCDTSANNNHLFISKYSACVGTCP